jgi:hypothetical protein
LAGIDAVRLARLRGCASFRDRLPELAPLIDGFMDRSFETRSSPLKHKLMHEALRHTDHWTIRSVVVRWGILGVF